MSDQVAVQVDSTQTEAFRSWFGDSKVVDLAGRPLVVFHGAPDARFVAEDGTFKTLTEKYGGEAPEGGAHWFAADRNVARTYANDVRAFDYQYAEPAVISAYLKLENPMVIDAGGRHWREVQRVGKTSNVIAKAKAEGHDGVIILTVKDDYNNENGGKRTTDTYVVWRSTQIKIAAGNCGAFDPSNADIRQSVCAVLGPGESSDRPGNTQTILKGKEVPERMFTAVVPRSGQTGLSNPPQTGTAALDNVNVTGLAPEGDKARGLLDRLQASADSAYCDYVGLCRRDECLGWEAKVEKGIFGEAELRAHKDAAEKLGRHRALQEAANLLHELPTLKTMYGEEPTTSSGHVFEAGDKVFVASEQRLATVLDVYGDGVNGSHGDVRVDLCGNTAITDLEPYDPIKHAAFDSTFIPIKAEWKANYGITKDVPLREEMPAASSSVGRQFAAAAAEHFADGVGRIVKECIFSVVERTGVDDASGAAVLEEMDAVISSLVSIRHKVALAEGGRPPARSLGVCTLFAPCDDLQPKPNTESLSI